MGPLLWAVCVVKEHRGPLMNTHAEGRRERESSSSNGGGGAAPGRICMVQGVSRTPQGLRIPGGREVPPHFCGGYIVVLYTLPNLQHRTSRLLQIGGPAWDVGGIVEGHECP